MELSHLVHKIGEKMGLEGLVRQFAIEKIANELYTHVECFVDPRADTDWRTAVEFVNGTKHLDISTLSNIFVSDMASYFRESRSLVLPDDIRKFLMDTAVMDLSIGGRVWSNGYAILVNQLPRPPYGRILRD